MHLFSKLCACHGRRVPFRSGADFDAHAVEAVYCPACVDAAPSTALHVAVMAVPGWTGRYALVLNQAYLAHVDPGFAPNARYAHALVERGRLSFGFLPHAQARRSFVVLGQKKEGR